VVEAGVAAERITKHTGAEQKLLWTAGVLLAVCVAIYVLIPIVIAVVTSFSDGNLLRFPVTAWSVRWYRDFFSSPQYVDALFNSVVIAVGATALSTLAGTAAAWAITQHSMAGRKILSLLILLPLFMPGVVLGLGVAVTFGNVQIFGHDIFGSRFLVILSHALWGMPLVFMLMETAFISLDRSTLEASSDLGAGPHLTFFEIVLPEVSVALLSSALFAFVISINEFYMALFLTTRDTQTLPVLMWLALRSAGTPRLAVAAVILLTVVLLSLMVILFGYSRSLRTKKKLTVQ
jgi:ABC-type spermidine/putrescine transport system permease subunit II